MGNYKTGSNCYKKAREKLREYDYQGTNIALLQSRVSKRNKTGIKGVTWYAPFEKWCARISVQGKTYHLGYFNTLEEASAVRKEAESKFHEPLIESYKEAKFLDGRKKNVRKANYR